MYINIKHEIEIQVTGQRKDSIYNKNAFAKFHQPYKLVLFTGNEIKCYQGFLVFAVSFLAC